MLVAIVDYEAGNLRSVQRACKHVDIEAYITSDPDQVVKADRVIFPGVGAATSGMETLNSSGLGDALREYFNSGKPLLGICLGAQVVLEFTQEGKKDCLGLIEGTCEKFQFTTNDLKIPHMGWNEIEIVQPHPMLAPVSSGDEFYFVHSYFARPADKENVYCITEHGYPFCSALGKDNLFATQFHLEKSGEKGLAVLKQFANWNP